MPYHQADRSNGWASRIWAVAALAAISFVIGRPSSADERVTASHFRQRVQPILARYCYDCHGNGSSEGGRKLDEFANDAALAGNTDLWHAVLKNVRAGIMPPAGEKRPTADERRQLFDWIEFDIFGIDAANVDPGRNTLRRLNRVEYRNTVRDLLGVDYNTGEQFPPDDSGYGFDNIGEVLSMSPLLMEKYLAAAEAIVARALPGGAPAAAATQGNRGRQNAAPNPRRILVDGPPPADVEGRDAYARKILAQFATRAYRRPAEDEFVERLVEIANASYVEGGESFEAGIGRALSALLASPRFVFRIERSAPDSDKAKFPLVDEFSLASRLSYFLWSTMPDDELLQLAGEGQLRKQLPQQIERMLKDGRSAALVENFAGQWLRSRDVEQVTIEPLAALDLQDDLQRAERELRQLRGGRRGGRRGNAANRRGARADTAERGNQSPGQPSPPTPLPKGEGSNSIEDEQAEQERQRQERLAAVTAERDRLTRLRDSFNARLRTAMRRETEMTFGYVLKNDRSVLELVDSDYTFLNEALANHYGVEGVTGQEMRRVELPPDSPRGGLLTQGTLLAVTSNPTRTSPVKRGQYILENILGTPAPPPPVAVPPLEKSSEAIKDHPPTIREAMELHRREPLCTACHARMDPLGLALENFNALGMWRMEQNEQPIDPSGKLLTGEKFDNLDQLKKIIAGGHRLDFYRCLAEKMLTYALGRGLDYHDEYTLDQIAARMEAGGGRISALVGGIVDSAQFQRQRRLGEPRQAASGD